MVTKPPFRADQVGSLLRPPELREARAKAKAGALTAAQLKDVEDRCIRAAVARQESLGLRAVTDGEYRRDFWHLDFMAQLEGVGMAAPVGMVFAAEDVPPMATIIGKVRCSTPIMVDHFAFLKSMAKATPKLTIPSPAMLHMRGGRNAVSRDAYPDLAEFWRDAAAGYRAAIGHIAAAGCTYLQLDDVSWAYLCDAKVRDNFRANGDDPATLPGAYVALVNGALANRPAGMTVTMHTCRGNFRSTWFAAGGYADGVVEAMFRARGRLRAAAPAAARQDGRAGARHHQVGRARVEGRAAATDRRGREVRAAGAPGPVAPVRLRQHAPRQHADRGRAVEEARARRRGRSRRVGRVT